MTRVRGLVRRPVAAGTFYPREPARLHAAVDALLAGSTGEIVARPWGIVVPHAGYAYSGPIAATAYGALRPWAADIGRVAVFGPAHFVPLMGCAVPEASAWRTPFGEVEIDPNARANAVSAGCLVADEPHAPEHALEVQMPFLQRVVGSGLRILPVAVGFAVTEEVVAVLNAIEGSVDLVVVSTDLSHYLDIDSARAADRRTADTVLACDARSIGPQDACGVFALRGVVAYAAETDRPIELLDLRTSGDTAGDPDRVVGYGAFTIGVPETGAGGWG